MAKFFIGFNLLACAFSGYKAIGKLLLFKPIGLVFWGGLFAFTTIGARNGLTYSSRYIRELNLI